MRVLVTGANGFIGQSLVRRLLAAGTLAGQPIAQLDLLDLRFDEAAPPPRVTHICGSVADAGVLSRALALRPDYIFHLACIAGGAAEANYALSLAVNLHATLNLLEGLRALSHSPVLVYTSSIGVYGSLPEQVDDDTPAAPTWTYGAHKLVGEVLMQDYTRRGWVDSRTLRLPAIVARPPAEVGALSAFISDIIRSLAAGQPNTCPVSASATAWWMSVECCVDNLIHAASIPCSQLPEKRSWMLPALRFSLAELVGALGEIIGTDVAKLVTYAPNPEIERRFGCLPPLHVPRSVAMGFRHDGSIAELVRRALPLKLQEEVAR